MIYLKNEQELQNIKKSSIILKQAIEKVTDNIKAGVTTKYLDDIAYNYIVKQGGIPACLNYGGFPATLCISIDNEVIHGIPTDKRYIEEGQLVSIDSGVIYNGYYSDMARTIEIGAVGEAKRKLNAVTKQAFFEGVEFFKEGGRLGDISSAIGRYVTSNGFAVVRDFVGHGIGRNFHEDPSVPNYGVAGRGVRLQKGMVLAIEPMVNTKNYQVKILDDDWTVIAVDKLPSAHYENTVALTENGIEILTL